MSWIIAEVTGLIEAVEVANIDIDIDALQQSYGPTFESALAGIGFAQVDEAYRAVVALLERCTLQQLETLKLTHIGAAQRNVSRRVREQIAANSVPILDPIPWTPELEAEARRQGGPSFWDADDQFTTTDLRPPEATELLADDDELTEPTDLDEESKPHAPDVNLLSSRTDAGTRVQGPHRPPMENS